MPELPEVETVRDGLERHVVGRGVQAVDVRREYSVRRHDGGAVAFAGQLVGQRLVGAARRGKFLWLPLEPRDLGCVPDAPVGAGAAPEDSAARDLRGEAPAAALVAHLGMSGQLLVRDADVDGPHVRVRISLTGGVVLDFVDQRTFGHLSVQDLVPTPDGAPGGRGSASATVPASAAHIARDLLDPALDRAALIAAIRRRHTGIKRALLDQGLVSGVGNIYADEALWRARVHYARATDAMRPASVARVLDAAREVMSDALAQGGTSFDALYVNVNGASGYFSRSLAVYGREGRPCPRCGTPIRRDAFMNRSSHFCPRCQRKR